MEKGFRRVDTTLRKRRLISNFLRKLEEKDITLVKMERIADRLLEMGKEVIPVLLKHLENVEDEELISRYALIIEYLNYEDFINPLINIMLKKKNYNNVASLLTTLRNLNAELISPFFYKLSSRLKSSLLFLPPKNLDNEDRALLFIEEFLDIPRDLQFSLIKKYSKSQEYIEFLDILVEHHDPEIVKAVIDALGRIPSDRSYRILNRVIKQSGREELIKRAKRSLLRLKFLGFEGELKTIPSPPVYRSYITYYDCEGNRSIWMARSNEKNPKRVDTIWLIINDLVGIKETFGHKNILKDDFDSIIERIEEDETLVEVEYDYLLRLISDAMHINYIKGIPFPMEFLFRKKIFYEDLLPPEPYNPSFEDILGNGIEVDREMEEKMGSILEREEFRGFILESERVYEWIRSIMNCGMDGLYERFYKEVINPELEWIKRRLILTADLMKRRGASKEELLPVLSAIYRIEDYNNPFIKRLALESLGNSLSLLRAIGDVIQDA